MNAATLARWKRDPVAFIREVLIDPETGQPFVLYPAQERFLRAALTVGANGRLPFPELVFGAPKKSGKTATAGMAMLYVVVVLGGRYAEGYCVANDLEQAQGRVFQAIARMVEASPLLRDAAKVSGSKIEFPSTGSTITALASDFASAAGGNPSCVCFDELWAYTSERSRRLWDELVPVPTRKGVSVRLTTTYGGFEGESDLLLDLYRRGLTGRRIGPALYKQKGLLMLWSHKPVAPWQSKAWLAQMRRQLRPAAFLRMIETRFVTSESSFVEEEWWSACEDAALHPMVANATVPIWVGVDASVKRDATAIVACSWDPAAKKVRLVSHRVFQPTPREPLDFEATVEQTLLDLRDRFDVREVRFDPFQMVAVAQRLAAAGLPMVEFPQSVPNLTEASTNLYELVKGANLAVYVDDGLRLAIHRAVAIETSRGWKISKRAASHRIDLVVALAQAALGATKNGQAAEPGYVTAVNLAPSATRTAHLSDADRDEIRGYEREQRQWARDEFRRELNLAGDGPGEAAYGGGYGSRRW